MYSGDGDYEYCQDSSSRSGRHTVWRIGSGWKYTTSRPRALGTGMTFVIIEPGIYIREAALDSLPKAPENAAFIDKVRPAVQNFLLRANTYLSGSPAARLAFRSASSASSTSLRAASCSCASFAFLNTSIALRTAHCSAIDVAATVMPSAFEKAA